MVIVRTQKIQSFLNDIVEVYQKHGLALGHEDSQGAFIVEKYEEEFVKWLFEAYDSDNYNS